MMRIKTLPTKLRPREKLLKYGPEALSITELLIVILITGSKSVSVVKLAAQIAHLLTRNTVTSDTLEELKLGSSKMAQILAVLEIHHRLAEKPDRVVLHRPQEIFAQSYEIIRSEKESLLCFYLNARGELLKKEVVVVGNLNRVNLLPREIFSVIKDLPVAGIILVHNHPSGDLDASPEDIDFTKRVKSAGEILGVELLDHLIVSAQGWKRIKI